ncbi:hypothetical protein WMF04_30675 [Sorangium sp. So ce260]|uniref:hypothetical protein n=1 Tax=Sorangium sp. So ce260 TaxID=3133291 RepID=UPI003F64058A
MSERRSQVDDFTRLTEETERLARHVEDLRLRIAATTAKRRASSGTLPAQSAPPIEGHHGSPSERPPHGPPSERPHHRSLSERPHDAASERLHDAASERTHDASSERAHDASPERAHDAASERAHDASSERPHDAGTERPRPRHSPFPERPSCLANVSRWLPPLKPGREVLESGIHERMGEAGRYCIVTPRKKPSAVPPRRRTPKADVA